MQKLIDSINCTIIMNFLVIEIWNIVWMIWNLGLHFAYSSGKSGMLNSGWVTEFLWSCFQKGRKIAILNCYKRNSSVLWINISNNDKSGNLRNLKTIALDLWFKCAEINNSILSSCQRVSIQIWTWCSPISMNQLSSDDKVSWAWVRQFF
jgi:hypothetical protein